MPVWGFSRQGDGILFHDKVVCNLVFFKDVHQAQWVATDLLDSFQTLFQPPEAENSSWEWSM